MRCLGVKLCAGILHIFQCFCLLTLIGHAEEESLNNTLNGHVGYPIRQQICLALAIWTPQMTH